MKKPVFPILLLNLAACLSAAAIVIPDRTNVCGIPVNNVYAIPDDAVDDKPQIDAAIAQGRSIYFPPGTYIYNGSAMTLPAGKSFRIYGDGPGVATILFSGPGGGINAPSMGPNTLNVEGLTLKANNVACGSAISATFAPNAKVHTATIHNVQIIGSTQDGTTGYYWTNGISLTTASAVVIDKVQISGNKNVTLAGITVAAPTAGPTPPACTGIEMSNLEIKWCNRALLTTGHVEGVYVTGFEFVSCGRPLNTYAVDLNSQFTVLLSGLVDSFGGGVKLTNTYFSKVSNVNFTHTGGSELLDGTMLWFNNDAGFEGVDAMISDCSFKGVSGVPPDVVAQENGIYLSHQRSVRIAGNNFSQMQPGNGSCIVADATSSLVRVTDNLFSNVRNKIANLIPQPPPNPPDPYYFGNSPSLP